MWWVLSFTVCLIRNLLDNQQDMNSDTEDEFVPSKKELQSSSEEEEDEQAGLDSDEEVVSKKGRHLASASRTPRSKQNTRSSSKTPRRTPSRKVKFLKTFRSKRVHSPFSSHLIFVTVSCLDRSRMARHELHIMPLPASPAGPCQPESLLTFWRRQEQGETHWLVTSDPEGPQVIELYRCCSRESCSLIGWSVSVNTCTTDFTQRLTSSHEIFIQIYVFLI